MSLRNQLIGSVSGIAILRISNLGMSFVISILLARYLGPDGYGVYTFILALIGALALISYAGVPQLLVKEIAKYEQFERWDLILGIRRRGNQFAGVLSLLTMALTVFVSAFYWMTVESVRWWLLFVASPLVPILVFSTLRAAFLQGVRRVVLGSIPEMLIRPALFLVIFGALVYLVEPTPSLAFAAQIIASTAAFFVGFFLVRYVIDKDLEGVVPKYQDKEWFASLVPFTGIVGVSYFNAEFVTLVLGLVGSNDDVAIFRVAVSLGLIVSLPLSLVETVIRPHITRLYNGGQYGTLQRLTQIVSLGTFLIALVPATVFIVYGDQLITLLYGPRYMPAYSSLVAVVIGYTLVNVVGLSMVLLYSTEFQSSAFRISALGAVLTIVLCAVLIPVFGALGAAIVVGAGKALRATLFVLSARRNIGIKTSLLW